MNISNYISLLGGVALFLFGMTLMGEGLKKVAGSKLELVLYKLSSTPLKGLLLGTGVTAVIQSSSATSVMVVGFVNSGMMKTRQAIAVIMGALIGTSITGWILCLSYIEGTGPWVSLLSTSTISAVVAVVGIVLRMFSKKSSHHHLGDILLGFAVLMFGMQSMSSAVSPLRKSETFINLMTTFSNPLLGIAVGAVFTAVIQSASAACGILQALSVTGAVTFDVAYPMLLGIAIGAAVPVLLSALGAKLAGQRAAVSYLLIEVLGAVICGGVFYAVNAFVDFGFMSSVMSPVSIAAVNSIFRAVTALILLPCLGGLEKLVCWIIKDKKEEKNTDADFDRLDERFLKHPALAIEQCRETINAMSEHTMVNIIEAVSLIKKFDSALAQKVSDDEDLIDKYEDKLGTYLMKINGSSLDPDQNHSLTRYLHTLSDFERISDHAMNICESARELCEKKMHFSEGAKAELDTLIAALKETLDLAFSSFVEEDIEKAYRVEPLEDLIDVLCDEMKLRHIKRLQAGQCQLEIGFVFNDLLTNIERVSDHCSNIAISLIEMSHDAFDAHSYVLELKEQNANRFDELFKEYSAKYVI